MSETGFILFWPGRPVLSVVLLVVAAVVVLYMARGYAHRLILSAARAFHGAMRLASKAVLSGVQGLKRRNREVLLAAGAEQLERQIEREFQRIGSVVTKDLEPYPALHRSMSDLITSIDEDYRKSTETPLDPPDWLDAVRSVAAIPAKDESLVARMLQEIKKTLESEHEKSTQLFRKTSAERHGLLKRMMPYWRQMARMLESMEKTISGILDRADLVDRKVQEYKDVLAGSEKAVRMLSSSSLTQFFISGIVLAIAIGGGMVNFSLIALPMSEMVGSTTYIGPFRMSEFAALVIILVETTMGVFLMEALRFTRLFPIIGTMEDRKRIRFMLGALTLLVIMALIESSLAFMRDVIVADKQALIQSLAGAEGDVIPETMNWIPTVGQMVMGFILPFALACVAIPFESFVHSARTVLGLLAEGFLNALAFVLRFMGNIVMGVGKVLVDLYDLVSFPLLWVEKHVAGRAKKSAGSGDGEEVAK
jgi:hypothetical protein